MKKWLSLFLAMLLVFGTIPPIVAIDVRAATGFSGFVTTGQYFDGRFSDVHSSDWFASGVKSAYEHGLMNGNSGTTFNPIGEITIAETVVLACRINSTYTGVSGVFSGGNPWYQRYIDYAITHNVIKSDEYSNYTAKASRADFAKIVYASLPAEAWNKINNVEKLPDVKSSDKYSASVFALYNAGILTGSDQYGTFKPSSNITRSEVATIVTRVALPKMRREFTLVEQLINEGTSAGEPVPPTRSTVTIHGVPSDTIVYVSQRSNTIHKVYDCSGMKKYNVMTIEEADLHGYKYCPNCW